LSQVTDYQMQTLICKKCKKAFRKDAREFEERSELTLFVLRVLADYRSDEYCPHCDNHYVLEALEPKAALKVESEDVRMDAR
jgi:hypothetical protein